ncbi:replication protein [Aggregatibacter sp. Marseille-P9115]|uniref:replication protein n=1 Tax=Aggregatibacter sp. Marseille-P9115 TaxID=2866570 RepID=UPI001E5B3DB1|nr:replication protein [Aggregatibacter sp. Marseille-P9115]
MSKFIPNAFQIPNSVIDELLAKLTCAELKCYLFVVRKTKGWNKESDSISVSQFMEVTGLSNRSIITACESLVEMGLLERSGGERKLNTYSVKAFDFSETGEKSSPDKTGENFSETGEKSSPDLVKKVHTQNNNKNTIQNNNKKNTKKSESDLLAEFGIVGQLADDFITHRKACKAPITETVLKGFQREADSLGMPIAEAVAYAIERGWRGFKADWYRRDLNNQPAEQMPANKPKFSNDQAGWSAGVEVEVDGQLWKF